MSRSIHAVPDEDLVAGIISGDLILQVDALRSDYDLFKLTPALATLVSMRLNDGRAAHAGVQFAAESQQAASQRVIAARRWLGALLRDGHQYLNSIPEEDVPHSDVVQALETYGFERGKIGDLDSPSRAELLGRAAGLVSPQLPALLRYPAHVLTRITTWLGVLDASKRIAGGGKLQAIIDDKNAKRDLLLKAIARVRHHYCAASDEADESPQLARIGLPPRRSRRAAPPTLPAKPAKPAFEATTHEMSVAVLPAGAVLLIAWRKAGRGQAEPAGVSAGATVGVSDFAPLEPGATYDFWVTGRNARGDGPPSTRVKFQP